MEPYQRRAPLAGIEPVGELLGGEGEVSTQIFQVKDVWDPGIAKNAPFTGSPLFRDQSKRAIYCVLSRIN